MDASEAKLLRAAREGGASFDVFENPSAPEIYADSVSNLMMNLSVSRLELTRTKGLRQSDDQQLVEDRYVEAYLTIPTMQLVELSAKVLLNYQKTSDFFNQNATQMTVMIQDLIGQLKNDK